MLGRLGIVRRAAGDDRTAARLLGAFKALRDAAVGGDASTRTDCDQDEKEAFAQYQTHGPWLEGLGMSYEEAIDLALSLRPAAASARGRKPTGPAPQKRRPQPRHGRRGPRPKAP